MSIKIVTDSTCDLPDALVAEYGITVVPLYINVGAHSCLDGVDLSREEFYERLPTYDPPPATAAPGPGTFREIYERLTVDGATEILSIHVSGSLSSTLNNARLAAAETKASRVTVFDSRQASIGLGFLVLTAARAVAEGGQLAEVVALLEEQILRTYLVAALDTLEYLKRSGRLNQAIASLGSLLQIKPIVNIYSGEPGVERVRTRKRALKRLVELLTEVVPAEQFALIHSHAPDQAEAFREQVRRLLPAGEILSVEVTPILGTHVGPGGVGFVCVTARSK